MGPISHHLGGASLSLLILSSRHQAQNIIAKPLIAPSYDLSHIFPIFSTCTTLLSIAPLLCLSYCNPSCCPLATLHYTYSTPNTETPSRDKWYQWSLAKDFQV